MIPVKNQWAIHLDVTNKCKFQCSNCTRMTAHAREPFFMDLETVEKALLSIADFATDSPPDPRNHSNKVIGLIGGEPTLHPDFLAIIKLYERIIPNPASRGLWSCGGKIYDTHRDLIKLIFGYENYNSHVEECIHQPMLIAIDDAIDDEVIKKQLIEKCWVQEQWASTITPKGCFFCEVAGAFDMIFNGPGGLPIEPGWWRRPLSDFQEQIDMWCGRCGAALPLDRRHDHERRDDISESNLCTLKDLGSPRILKGNYCLFNKDNYDQEEAVKNWQPNRYLIGRYENKGKK